MYWTCKPPVLSARHARTEGICHLASMGKHSLKCNSHSKFDFILILFYNLPYVIMCGFMCLSTCVIVQCMEARGHFQELVLSFHRVSHGAQAQVVWPQAP